MHINYAKKIKKGEKNNEKEILKITNKLFTDNRENEGADDIDKNPYAAGVHDGILDVLTSLGIDCEEEFIN